MNAFYEWLYHHYAAPRLSGIPFSSTCQAQSQEWQFAAESLSRHDRLLARDLMDTIKNEWGALTFAYGIQVGIILAADLETGDFAAISRPPAA